MTKETFQKAEKITRALEQIEAILNMSRMGSVPKTISVTYENEHLRFVLDKEDAEYCHDSIVGYLTKKQGMLQNELNDL